MTTNWIEEFNQFMETLPKRVGETHRDLLLNFITTLLEKQREEYENRIEEKSGLLNNALDLIKSYQELIKSNDILRHNK